MVRGEAVVGLIVLLSDKVGYFSQEMTSLLEASAAHVVLAINNARLYEDVRTGQERMQALSHRLVEVQESERRYVARELHDEASQALTSLMVGLKLLERDADQPEAILSGTAQLKRTLEVVMEEIHRLAIDLRPASLDHLGLISALRQYAESANQKYGIPVQFESVGIDQRLDSSLETALYRITQEALINSIRHANATRVDILLEQRGEKLVLIIEDDGVGFDPDEAMHSGRLGMVGMRERAEMVGGELVIESSQGVGTAVCVEVPLGNPHIVG
jgi:signal transduction histidine kinase